MKFVLIVEGRTEKLGLPHFLKRWLDPQLVKPVGVEVIKCDGWSDYRKTVPSKARLAANREGVIGVIGLLDLYMYPPNSQQAQHFEFYPQGVEEPGDRWRWGRTHIENLVSLNNFRQHFAVHEIEAWMLCSSLLPALVADAVKSHAKTPENVNGTAPPSKLLENLYREKLKDKGIPRKYVKTVDGPALLRGTDPITVAQRCPALQALLSDMLLLVPPELRKPMMTDATETTSP